MHPSNILAFARLAGDYAQWRAVSDARRSEAPASWWGPAMAVRGDTTTLDGDVAAMFALPPGSTYADAAALILPAFGDQTYQPWPGNFPEKYMPKVEDPAPSAEPAAQAASAAIVPIA